MHVCVHAKLVICVCDTLPLRSGAHIKAAGRQLSHTYIPVAYTYTTWAKQQISNGTQISMRKRILFFRMHLYFILNEFLYLQHVRDSECSWYHGCASRDAECFRPRKQRGTRAPLACLLFYRSMLHRDLTSFMYKVTTNGGACHYNLLLLFLI